jgi:acetate kinase
MHILVLNSGSSSLKFRIIEVSSPSKSTHPAVTTHLHGAVSGIARDTTCTLSLHSGATHQDRGRDISDHTQAVQWMWDALTRHWPFGQTDSPAKDGYIDAVGVRVVHGGPRYTEATVLDNHILKDLEALTPLAPLHNPPCLEGIHRIRSILGSKVPIVAVFDTAFHHTLPEHAYTYAIPERWTTTHGVRRFGFHGIAHASLAGSYADYSGRSLDHHRLITFQLGQGCSVTAIQHGAVVETSMGFTPLEGLVMGTRSGDIDPAILSYIGKQEELSLSDLDHHLNTQSGLLGISGFSSDMRTLLEAAHYSQDRRAKLAVEIFCHRAKKYLGAYLAILGGADAVIFGGGIGEHAPGIRAKICEGMEWIGLSLDSTANAGLQGLAPGTIAPIHARQSAIKVLVGGTEEESWIARETFQRLRDSNYPLK